MQNTKCGSDNFLMIDNRFNPRYSVAQNVSLARLGGHPNIFRTRNVCHDGMFIETRHTDLQPGESLTAVLYLQSAGIHVQPFTVDVVHRTDDGIGVLVSDPSLDIDLLNLVNQHKTGKPAAVARERSDDNAGLQVNWDRRGNGFLVTLRAGPMLDLRIVGLVACIRRFFVNSHHLSRVDIDLRDTRSIMDSGLAILLFLKRSLGTCAREIRLVNASDSIRERLALLLKGHNGFVID